MARLNPRTVRLLLPGAINLVSIALSFLLRFALAKVTGATAFGIFSVWFNNLQLFGLVGMFGQQNHALRLLAEHAEDDAHGANRASLEILRFATITGTATALAGAIVFYWLQGGTTLVAVAQAVAVIAFVPLTVLSSIHRSFGSFVIGILFDRLIPQLLFFLLILGAIASAAELESPEAVYTALLVGSLALSLGFLVRTRGHRFGDFIGDVAMAARLRDALPYFLLSLGLTVNGRYMLAMAGMFYSGPVLGEIGLLVTIVSLVLIPGTTLNLVLGPTIARNIASDNDRSKLRLASLYLGGCTALSALAGIVIGLAYSPAMSIVGFRMSLSEDTVWAVVAGAIVMAMVAAVTFIEQMAGQAGKAVTPLLAILAAKLAVAVGILRFAGFRSLAYADLLLSFFLLAVISLRFLPTIRRWQAGCVSPSVPGSTQH